MKKPWIFFLIVPTSLAAINATWISTDVAPQDENWDNTHNWNTGTIPNGVDDSANFTSDSPPIPANPVVEVTTSPTTLGALNIDSATNYTIQPTTGTLQFSATSGSATLTVTSNLGNGTHTISVPIALASGLTISQSSTGGLTISSIISGAHNLTKTGSHTLTLTGNNNYNGGKTTISQGTLSISADNNLGNSSNTLSIGNATLQCNESFGTSRLIELTDGASINVVPTKSVTLSGKLSGAGSLTKTGSGVLILNQANEYTGGTTINAGTLSIGSDENLGNSSGELSIGNATLLTTAPLSSSRSGSFTSTAIIDTNANASTFSGNFGGSGSLTIQNGGTITLAGTNSYSGGTILGASSGLIGNTNSIQGTVRFTNAFSTLNFTQNTNGTYAGTLISSAPGAGTLVKYGGGTVIFSASSTGFTGATTIVEGALEIDGSLSNSTVTVGSGGVLRGAGTVGPTTSVGIIDPGTSTTSATLSINGSLTLNPGSRVHINLSPLTSDRLAVNGAATLTGALLIDPTPGFYGFIVNHTILNSTGLILAPGFSPIESTNSAFQPTVVYTANDVLLQVIISEPFALFPFSNVNTQAVGQNIDALYPAGQLSNDLFNLFNSLVGQSNAFINSVLDQMHPAPYSAFAEYQAETGGQLLSLFHRQPYLPCGCSSPNRLWVEGFGNSLHIKNHGIQFGFQANSGGVAVGYDGQITDSFLAGIGGAWNYGNLDWLGSHGGGEINSFYGALYFDAQGDNFYLGGSFLMGMDFYDTSRHIQFLSTNRHAHAEFQALDAMGQISMAYLFGAPQAFFYPYANIDYLYLHTHDFHETGANGLDLAVRARTDMTLRSELGLGLQVQDRNPAETACISPTVSLGWVNMYPLKRPHIGATFAGASIPFTAVGWNEVWNLMNLNFALGFAHRCFGFKIQYNVEFSTDSDTTFYNQNGDIRLDWKW